VGRGVHFANRYVARTDPWPHETVRTSLSGPMTTAGQRGQDGTELQADGYQPHRQSRARVVPNNHIDRGCARQLPRGRRGDGMSTTRLGLSRQAVRSVVVALPHDMPHQGEPEGRSCFWDPIHPSGWTTRGLCTSLRARSAVQWTSPGGVAERLNAPVLKTGGPSRVPRVRISPPPPIEFRVSLWPQGPAAAVDRSALTGIGAAAGHSG
jgi:hypothetical protein